MNIYINPITRPFGKKSEPDLLLFANFRLTQDFFRPFSRTNLFFLNKNDDRNKNDV